MSQDRCPRCGFGLFPDLPLGNRCSATEQQHHTSTCASWGEGPCDCGWKSETVRLSHTVPGFDHRKNGFHVVVTNSARNPVGVSSRVKLKDAQAFAQAYKAQRPDSVVSIYGKASSPALTGIEVDELLEVI